MSACFIEFGGATFTLFKHLINYFCYKCNMFSFISSKVDRTGGYWNCHMFSWIEIRYEVIQLCNFPRDYSE